MRYSELCGKEVVDIKNGRVIGRISDLCFLENNYVIKEFFVSQPENCVKKLFPWFFSHDEITISTNDIINIGEDVILVQLD